MDGGGGARSAPLCVLMSPKKTGARSARARTRGQNPLVYYIPIDDGMGQVLGRGGGI